MWNRVKSLGNQHYLRLWEYTLRASLRGKRKTFRLENIFIIYREMYSDLHKMCFNLCFYIQYTELLLFLSLKELFMWEQQRCSDSGLALLAAKLITEEKSRSFLDRFSANVVINVERLLINIKCLTGTNCKKPKKFFLLWNRG